MKFTNKLIFWGWIPDQVRNDRNQSWIADIRVRNPACRQAGRNDNAGFTFVELLVVITIIGIIFASGIVAFTSLTIRSRDTRRRSDLEAIRQSLEMCRSLAGSYPTSIYDVGGISCSVSGPVLMSIVPTDPKPGDSCASQYAYVRATTTTYTLTACQESGGTYQVASP